MARSKRRGAPNRILVLGCPGAGKTTLARQLASDTGLPLYHLDDEYWGAGWTRPDPRRWERRQRELTAGESWIIDGNYLPTIHLRAARADLVVLVDTATTRCLLRVLARAWRIHRGDHSDLPLRVRAAAASASAGSASLRGAGASGPVRATRDLLPLLWMIIRFRARDWRAVVERACANPDVAMLVAVGRRRPGRRVAAVRGRLESLGAPSIVLPMPAAAALLRSRPAAPPGAKPHPGRRRQPRGKDRPMRVLVAWPPHVPSYFNAGHHLPTFTIAAYLRANGHLVDALDAGALNYSWKEFGDRVFQGRYQAIVLVNEFDLVEGLRRAVDYCRALAPDAFLVTAGRLSYQNPGFFRTLPLDAVVTGGDYEAGVAAALRWAGDGRPDLPGLPGVAMRRGDGWTEPTGPGVWLPAHEWALPDVADIPYVSYEQLYSRDQNKFCGIPQRRELVVPVARGCPIGCSFCDVPSMQGLRERRMTARRAVDYIRDCFARHPFEYVAFYAPTFTLDKAWVRQLCALLRAEPRRYPWKCATTLHHLDEALVEEMAAAGCVRISVGVETFEPDAAGALPRVKQRPRDRFEVVAAWCNRRGIELNCFVIVGLPGTTPEGARRTIEAITAAGARARPTLYTPYHDMRADMTEREISGFNRQLFADVAQVRSAGHEPEEFLKLIFGGDGYLTPVTARIPGAPRTTDAARADAVSALTEA